VRIGTPWLVPVSAMDKTPSMEEKIIFEAMSVFLI
jgi:hypothetical protein